MPTVEDLQQQIKHITAERNRYHAELTDLKLAQLRTDIDDHESRIRSLETVATRSNVLYALSAGGGAIGIIVLIRTLLGMP